MTTKYAVVNRSTLVSDQDCFTMWRAVDTQLRLHVAPAWERLPMEGVFVSSSGHVPTGHHPIYVLDDSDQANALGYHAEDPGGSFYGRVFASPILKAGGNVLRGVDSVSTIVSHEVIEIFIDRGCDLWSDRGDGTLVAYEPVDPVKKDVYQVSVYDLSGRPVDVSVSNFVLDAWFDPDATGSGIRYDWLGNVSAPFQMTPGGYMVIWDTTSGKIEQVFADRRQ